MGAKNKAEPGESNNNIQVCDQNLSSSDSNTKDGYLKLMEGCQKYGKYGLLPNLLGPKLIPHVEILLFTLSRTEIGYKSSVCEVQTLEIETWKMRAVSFYATSSCQITALL